MTDTTSAQHDAQHMIMPPGLRGRFDDAPATSVVDELQLERGTQRDYKKLASFHYQGGRPGAITTVFRMVHHAPSVVGRYVRRRDETMVVGVLVRSLPHLSCRMRDIATNGRYVGLDRTARARLVNRELRTISRVIVHPQWRGLGLAVRLVRHALGHPETDMTEALAAMGRVHPFFERAGMTRYDAPPRAEHARLLDALAHMNIEPAHLASKRTVLDHLEQSDQTTRHWLKREFARWHRAAFRTPRNQLHQLTFDDLITAARDHLLLQPVYYLTRHDGTVEKSHAEHKRPHCSQQPFRSVTCPPPHNVSR